VHTIGAQPGQRPTANVSIEWKAALERIIVLDEADATEGWTVVAEGRGQLSAGVCRALQEECPNKANVVYVSTQCPAKQVLQPNCSSAIGIPK